MKPEPEGSTTATTDLLPPQCPRFHTCSAPICPIDPVWRTAVHLWSERVCHYLLASGKPGAAERYADDPVFSACLVQLPEVVARHPNIGAKVAEAARYGFPEDRTRKLNRRRAMAGDACEPPVTEVEAKKDAEPV